MTYQQAAGTPATVAQFQTLANVMTGSANSPAVLAYYNANYGSLNPTQFITALYSNLGGPTNMAGIAPGVTYWTNQILAQEAAGTPQPLAYTNVLGQFVDSFLSYSGNDPSALARQQTLNNKVAVSEFYALDSQTNSFLIPTVPAGPAFLAVQNVIANVNATQASVVAAEALITAAVAQQSLAPLLVISGATYTLTVGQDTFVDTAGYATFNAPLAGIFGNQPTLTNFDSLVGNATIGGNVLNASFNGSSTVSGVNIQGVETWNIQNIDQNYGTVRITADGGSTAGNQNNIAGLTTLNYNANSGGDSLIIGDNAEPVQEVAGAFANTAGGTPFTINVSNAVGHFFHAGYGAYANNGVAVDFAASVFTGQDSINVSAYIVGGFKEINGSYQVPPPVYAYGNDADVYNPAWYDYLSSAYSIVAGASGSSLTTLNGVTLPSTGAVGFQIWNVSSLGAKSVGSTNILALGNEGSWNATTINLTDDGSNTILFASALADSLSTDWTNLTTLNLSGTSGYVVVTGAEVDAQIYISPSTSWYGGGLLTSDTTALETIKGGTGNSFYDLSSLTLAGIQAFKGAEIYDGGHSIKGNSEIAFNNFVVANATATPGSGTVINISHIQVLDDTGGIGSTNQQGGFIDLSGDFPGLGPLNTAYALLAGSPASGVFPSPIDPFIPVTGALYANDIVPVGYELLQLLNADGSTNNTFGAALTVRDGFTLQAINAQDVGDGALTYAYDANVLQKGSGVWTGYAITIEGLNTIPSVNTTDHLKFWVADEGIYNAFNNAVTATVFYTPQFAVDNYTTTDIYLPYESVGHGNNVQDYVVLGGAVPSIAGGFGFIDQPVVTATAASVNFYDNTADTGGSWPGGPSDLVLGYTQFTGNLGTANIGQDTVIVDATTASTGTTINDFGHGTLEIGATNAVFLNAQSTSHLIMDLPADPSYLITNSIIGASGITVNGSATGQNLIQGSSLSTFLDTGSGHGIYVLETVFPNGVGNDTLTGGADTLAGGVANFIGNSGDNFFPAGGTDIVNINSAGTSASTDSTVWFGAYDVGNSGGQNFGVNGTAGGADWGTAGVITGAGSPGIWGQAITDIVGGAEVYVDGYAAPNSLTINGFMIGGTSAKPGDTIAVYAPDWATGALTVGTAQGLVNEQGAAALQGTGNAIIFNAGFAGETANLAGAGLTLDSISAYANAAKLVTALTTSTVGDINFAADALGAHSTEHLLIAYQVAGAATPTVNIADVTITNTTGAALAGFDTATTAGITVSAIDLIHVTGTATNTAVLGQLVGHNVYFV